MFQGVSCFKKFETRDIPYIQNKLRQNQIAIFMKNLFRLKFQSNIRLRLQYAGPYSTLIRPVIPNRGAATQGCLALK